jgi:hypothetical protein
MYNRLRRQKVGQGCRAALSHHLKRRQLTYGHIVSVYASTDPVISALTDGGINELDDMTQTARITTKTWHPFLDDFVDDANLLSRIQAQSLR